MSLTSTLLSISDLHFNPCYDKTLVPTLGKAAVSEWEEIFESSKITLLSDYGEDTNYPLLKSFLSKIEILEEVEYVLFSGDFLGHHLRSAYESASGETNMGDFESFITKTFQFLVQKFKNVLPNVSIFPALGNDDSFDGDYRIAAKGGFLEMVHREWQEILPLPDSFKEGGYYSIEIPNMINNRLLVLNNTFMSTRYPEVAGLDEGAVQLEWLQKELEKHKDKQLWVMFHEPLGINIYPTVKKGIPENPEDVALFLKQQYYTPLLKKLKNYGEQVRIIFSGHTHMDSFRLLHSSYGEPLIYNHITPAVSPIFGNNPAFQVFTINNETNFARNYVTYFLDLQSDAPQWDVEYCFCKQYNQPIITPKSMQAVWSMIGSCPILKKEYSHMYDVSNSPIPESAWKIYYETMNEMTATAFSKQFTV